MIKMRGGRGGNTRRKASIIIRGRQTGTKERKIIFIFLSSFHIFCSHHLHKVTVHAIHSFFEETQTYVKQKMEQVRARKLFSSLLTTSAFGQNSPGVDL